MNYINRVKAQNDLIEQIGSFKNITFDDCNIFDNTPSEEKFLALYIFDTKVVCTKDGLLIGDNEEYLLEWNPVGRHSETAFMKSIWNELVQYSSKCTAGTYKTKDKCVSFSDSEITLTALETDKVPMYLVNFIIECLEEDGTPTITNVMPDGYAEEYWKNLNKKGNVND